jgi:antitoxin MazE
MGNSSGIIIPKPLLSQLGAKTGDEVEMLVEGGRLTIQPIKGHGRAGWAEDAKRIADSGDDALVWPEFANDDDATLTW